MSPRFAYAKLTHEAMKPLADLGTVIKNGSLDKKLLNLVDIRASQLNGCAFCVDMHVKQARLFDERDLRVHHLAVWRDSPLFNDKERAALEWTEALTHVASGAVTDEVYFPGSYSDIRKVTVESTIGSASVTLHLLVDR